MQVIAIKACIKINVKNTKGEEPRGMKSQGEREVKGRGVNDNTNI